MNASNDILWTAGFFNERFPTPVSPLGWSLLGPLIEDIALRDPLRFLGFPQAESMPLIRLWRGHPYSNALAFQIFYRAFPDALVPEDAYRYFPDGDVSLRKQARYPSSIFSPRFVIALLRSFLSDPLDFSPWHNFRKWARYTHKHDSRVDSLKQRLPQLADSDVPAIFAALQEAEDIHRRFLRIHRWSLMHADLTFGILKRLTRAWVSQDHGDEIAAVLVSGAPNKTMQVDAALRTLKEQVASESIQASDRGGFERTLPPQTLNSFRRFLAEHGHRSFSLDIAVPTFAEEPMQVVQLLRACNKQSSPPSAKTSPDIHLSGWRCWVLDSTRALAVRYAGLREDQRYYWQKSLALSRQLYLLLSERLQKQAVITDRSDVFFATHEELERYFSRQEPDLGTVIATRKQEWELYENESRASSGAAYPPFLRGDTPLRAEKRAQQEWKGRAVSPGSTQGAARVVRSARDLGRVQQGDILVAPSTDPAWTPVFSIISGLVMERGGVLSHGAVVAREYRVPAVAGVANILDEIQDGDWIQVDGSKGMVARFK